MTQAGTSSAPPPEKRFGAFSGVFTPSVLTILGVVMYMRVGWVTGHAGLGGALIIIAISHLISLSTGLSVSSIATNRTVGAGGAYFMISRSLGAPAGAAIGIPLFFAQALSVTFYIVGFTDALLQLLPTGVQAWLPPWLVSTAVNIGLTGLSLKSAELAIKAQYFVMAAIGLSLASIFGGQTPEFPRAIEWFNPDSSEDFFTVFAVFFPAVTGIMAGVSMSGDLRRPRRDLPLGTLTAIFVGLVVYVAIPIWLALNASNAYLVENVDSVFKLAWSSPLIYLGVWGATISSALGSILTAPRTLQALAWDGLMPRILGRGFGQNNEPRIGTALTFVLAQAGIMLGSLDAIAPVLTMFFLATYGVTNLACGLQKWAASPSFRPSFKVPALISLGGAAGCFWVMSRIDMAAMSAAALFCGVIFLAAQRKQLGTTYGDARHGIWSALVRTALQRLRRTSFHPLNWRPNLVILGGEPVRRPHLLELGSALVQDRGIVTYFHLLLGSVQQHAERRREVFAKNEREISERFPHVFYRVDIASELYPGAVNVAQSYGVGSFEANTVLLGWPKKTERSQKYVDMLRDLASLDRSLLLVRYDEARRYGKAREIQIWWGGLEGNGGLMLLLAFLLIAHPDWRKARVTVLTVVHDEPAQREAEVNIKRLLSSARLEAQTRVILRQRRSIPEIMREESRKADLAIVGFGLPDSSVGAEAFFERMNALLAELPTTLLVHSARNFESEPLLFDTDEDAG